MGKQKSAQPRESNSWKLDVLVSTWILRCLLLDEYDDRGVASSTHIMLKPNVAIPVIDRFCGGRKARSLENDGVYARAEDSAKSNMSHVSLAKRRHLAFKARAAEGNGLWP